VESDGFEVERAVKIHSGNDGLKGGNNALNGNGPPLRNLHRRAVEIKSRSKCVFLIVSDMKKKNKKKDTKCPRDTV
jgi:hypothetical protein